MKISMLVHDLSANSIVRTYPIAKVLQRKHEVEIIGPVFGKEIYSAYKGEFEYKTIKAGSSFVMTALPGMQKLCRKIEGEVIYAFKPMPASYGTALLSRLGRKRPIILDIEDLDGCFPRQGLANLAYPVLSNYSIKGWAYIKLMQKLSGFSDQITVSSNFLQKMFGGVKLPHGADCKFFDPKKERQKASKEKFGLEGKKVVLFSGTPSMHKGVLDLAEAVKNLEKKNVRLAIAGPKTSYLQSIMKKYDNCISYLGSFPHSKMPQILDLADLVVLPQRNLRYAQAQVPGKVFEAMAMEKPIIATSVSDLPEILGGCGWIVEPENPQKLAESIGHVLDNPKEAKEKGRRARKKCVEKYSWNAMEKILEDVFKEYE